MCALKKVSNRKVGIISPRTTFAADALVIFYERKSSGVWNRANGTIGLKLRYVS